MTQKPSLITAALLLAFNLVSLGLVVAFAWLALIRGLGLFPNRLLGAKALLGPVNRSPFSGVAQ